MITWEIDEILSKESHGVAALCSEAAKSEIVDY